MYLSLHVFDINTDAGYVRIYNYRSKQDSTVAGLTEVQGAQQECPFYPKIFNIISPENCQLISVDYTQFLQLIQGG